MLLTLQLLLLLPLLPLLLLPIAPTADAPTPPAAPIPLATPIPPATSTYHVAPTPDAVPIPPAAPTLHATPTSPVALPPAAVPIPPAAPTPTAVPSPITISQVCIPLGQLYHRKEVIIRMASLNLGQGKVAFSCSYSCTCFCSCSDSCSYYISCSHSCSYSVSCSPQVTKVPPLSDTKALEQGTELLENLLLLTIGVGAPVMLWMYDGSKSSEKEAVKEARFQEVG